MEIQHDPNADVIYIRFNHKPFHKNRVIGNDSMVVDLAEDGTVIGIELISPSRFVENLNEITYRQKTGSPPPVSSESR
jgi:uncharacterized protein YuzE